jgi:hypothetical protein
MIESPLDVLCDVWVAILACQIKAMTEFATALAQRPR